jgi:DNA-binding CsgD family transcriptional regulator/tetratricopeptide (TPR) repeat protein
VVANGGDPSRSSLLGSPEFVGRRRELASLADALSEPPAVVLVEGEAGIGKSRLLREFLASEAGRPHRGLVATCPPFRQPFTLGPVVDALREATDSVAGLGLSPLSGALRPLFPEWAADLPPIPDPAEDATAARHRLFRALAELLGCLEIAVLVVEDVHWADDATLEFLLFLASQQLRQISLVVTYRAADVPADSLLVRLSSRSPVGTTQLRLSLESLDAVETEALVSSMIAGTEVSAEFATFLHQHTDGIPLAVEESVRLMHDRADLVRRDGAWVRRRLENIAVPHSVRDAVLERAGRLGPDAQLVIRAAAVLAKPADEATLLAVAGPLDGPEQDGLAEALTSGLLHEDVEGLLALRHALACRAVLEAIPSRMRRAFHQRAGQALQALTPPPVARLAHHYREAGDSVNWSRYGQEAAESALAAGDHATATALLHDLITTAGLPAGSVAQLASILPFTVHQRVQYDAVVQALRRLVDADTLEPGEEAAIRFQSGRILNTMSDYAAAQAELERAIPHLAPGSADAARAMMILSFPMGNVKTASVHLAWLRRADEVASGFEGRQRLRLLVDRTTALLLLGEESGWTAAQQVPADGAPGMRGEVATGHLNVGHLAMIWGRYPVAARRLAQALDLAEKHQFARLRNVIVSTQAHLDWLTGRWDGLAATVAPLIVDDRLEASTRGEAGFVAGLLEAAAGNASEAEGLLRDAHAAADRGGLSGFVETAALARLWLADGRVDDVLDITDGPAEIAVHKGIWVHGAEILPVRVEALVAADRISEADELVSAFTRLVHEHDAPSPLAAVAVSRAILAEGRGSHALAATLFDEAADAWEAMPRPYDALLARERQARCMLAAGDGSAGSDVLTEVFRGLSELGAHGDAVRVMNALRQLGVDVKRPWMGGRRGYGDQLSPRELDVARALADGRTNRQIAEALFLSPRTVARHLDSAMRKLGVNSRTAVAVKVAEADGVATTPRTDPSSGGQPA